VDVPNWIESLRADGELLADAATATSLDTGVPGCPDWRVRDLLGHVGRVHRWARTVVAERIDEDGFGKLKEFMSTATPEDDELVDWFRAGHRDLVDTLAAAPADLECFTFMPSASPLTFWARRQAHETAVHRADAEQAAGRPSAFDPEFAEDGVDEVLTGHLPRSRKLRATDPRTLGFGAGERHWLVTIGPELAVTKTDADAAESADVTVTGPADALYLALWNRVPWDGLTTTGDAELATFWAGNFRVR
jgi:uncharacterized protein (TIGR03083 family)